MELSEDWSTRKAKVGDYAEVIRQLRNLLHPARYLKDHYRKRITRKHTQLVFDTMDTVNRFLGGKVEESLSRSLADENGSSGRNCRLSLWS